MAFWAIPVCVFVSGFFCVSALFDDSRSSGMLDIPLSGVIKSEKFKPSIRSPVVCRVALGGEDICYYYIISYGIYSYGLYSYGAWW